MIRSLGRSVRVTLCLVFLLCGVYPVLVWMIGNLAFHDKATGGIIYKEGNPVGAKLIGQAFHKPEYFHGRPSAAGAAGYDASNSAGSNLGPTNKKLFDRVSADVAKTLKENPDLKHGQVPTNLVTASGSGLDPHISPESAQVQIRRVAKTRNISTDQVKLLVNQYTEGRQFGFLGEPTVNVLLLNIALDQIPSASRKVEVTLSD